jgi:hypothetical protein
MTLPMRVTEVQLQMSFSPWVFPPLKKETVHGTRERGLAVAVENESSLSRQNARKQEPLVAS